MLAVAVVDQVLDAADAEEDLPARYSVGERFAAVVARDPGAGSPDVRFDENRIAQPSRGIEQLSCAVDYPAPRIGETERRQEIELRRFRELERIGLGAIDHRHSKSLQVPKPVQR